MSTNSAAPSATVVLASATSLTAFQVRLQWIPVMGSTFTTVREYESQLDVYMYVTGKRYERSKGEGNRKKDVVHRCGTEDCAGFFHLQIRRPNKRETWWVVQQVIMCECGSPPLELDMVRGRGLTALRGLKKLGTKNDWQLFANTFFPAGWSRKKISSRHVVLCCAREGCSGELNLFFKYTRGGYPKESPLRIGNVVGCTLECCEREEVPVQSSHIPPLVPPLSVSLPPLPPSQIICFLCGEDVSQWVELPCRQQTCCECLAKLVRTCPRAIQPIPNLVRFEPRTLPAEHCYTCPFCQAPYYPWTAIQLMGEGGQKSEVPVSDVVPTPYAYQSFDSKDLPAYVAGAADYDRVMVAYEKYLQTELEKRLRESAAASSEGLAGDEPTEPMEPATSAEDMVDLARAVVDVNYERLQILKQSGRFSRHVHEVLNFLEAVELLYDQELDSGFLQRVADAGTNRAQGRSNLLREAYEVGWEGRGFVDDRVVVALLLRKGLVEVFSVDGEGESESEHMANVCV